MTFTRTITIVRAVPGGLDKYGDPVEGTTDRIDEDGWSWAPRKDVTSEIEERGRQGVIVGLTGYGPYDSALRETDQVEIDGVLYDVEGNPGDWWNPKSGREAGIEVALRKAKG